MAAYSLRLVAHGWFCLDYAVVGLVALLLPRSLTPALLGFSIALDMLNGISETFYMGPADILRSPRALSSYALGRDFMIGVVLLVTVAVALSSRLLLRPCGQPFARTKAAVALVLFATTCVSLDAAESGTYLRRLLALTTASPVDTWNLAHFQHLRSSRYPARRLVIEQLFENRVERLARRAPLRAADSPSATSIAFNAPQFQAISHGQKPNIVLIVVESWGFALDSSLRNAFLSAYESRKLGDRYTVLNGTVPFYGSTVPGEVRALCSSKDGFEILHASSSELRRCLPETLAAEGYREIALHGMDGHLFDRARWYSELGFNTILFRDDFRKMGQPDCPGAFRGTCDSAVASWIGAQLQAPSKQPTFIYWLTLNSHLPVPTPPLLADPAPCSNSDALRKYPALCAWYQLEMNVHRAIAEIASNSANRPTAFIVVGDHAPPFSNPDLRASFAQDVVPYLILIPREASEDSGRDAPLKAGIRSNSEDRPGN